MRVYKYLEDFPYIVQVAVPFKMKSETFDEFYYGEVRLGSKQTHVIFSDHPWGKSRRHVIPVKQLELTVEDIDKIETCTGISQFHIVGLDSSSTFNVPNLPIIMVLILDFEGLVNNIPVIKCNIEYTPNLYFLEVTNDVSEPAIIEIVNASFLLQSSITIILPEGSKVKISHPDADLSQQHETLESEEDTRTKYNYNSFVNSTGVNYSLLTYTKINNITIYVNNMSFSTLIVNVNGYSIRFIAMQSFNLRFLV